MHKDLIYKNRILQPHKAFISPNFNTKPVQVRNHWEYVDVWLHKNKAPKEAKLYWNQSKNFYFASKELDLISAPLTLHYCLLNATKTLLVTKKVKFSEQHGLKGKVLKGNTSLKNEIIEFNSGGILPNLSIYLKDSLSIKRKFSLHNILYNLPYIHRCFCISNNLQSELYIPIINPKMVRHKTLHRGWFMAELEGSYANKHTLNKIKSLNYEKDVGIDHKFIIRNKKRFKWYYRKPKSDNNMLRFKNYHYKIRKNLQYIFDSDTSWYIKRSGIDGIINKSQLTLTYAAMHRLSELSRYNPKRLARHLELSQKWVISEFLSSAPIQFIDQISAEITHQNVEVTNINN